MVAVVRHRIKNGELSSCTSESAVCAVLTPREYEVLSRIAEGYSSKEVARSIGISPRTVEFHRANLRKKFTAKNTADLVRKASAKAERYSEPYGK